MENQDGAKVKATTGRVTVPVGSRPALGTTFPNEEHCPSAHSSHYMISPGWTNSSSITGGCVILLDGELENNQCQTCRENHQVEHGHFAFYVFWSWLLEPSENFLGGLSSDSKSCGIKRASPRLKNLFALSSDNPLTLEQLISEVWLLPAPNDVNGGHTSEVPSEFQRDGQCFPCLEFSVDHELLCPGLKVWRLCSWNFMKALT